MLACVSSRPGQCGRCDGYVLEGKELEFYIKKIEKKRWGGLKWIHLNSYFNLNKQNNNNKIVIT